MWRDIFHKLKDEGTVTLSYEASISTEMKCMIGDIPVYKFKVQYFKEGVDELITKTVAAGIIISLRIIPVKATHFIILKITNGIIINRTANRIGIYLSFNIDLKSPSASLIPIIIIERGITVLFKRKSTSSFTIGMR